MNSHSVSILEYQQVLQNCRGFSLVEGPHRGLATLPFFFDEDALRDELALVGAVKLLVERKPHGLGELPDAGQSISLLTKEGAVLELEQIARLVLLINSYAAVLVWINGLLEGEDLPESTRELMSGFIAEWDSPRDLLKKISPYFDSRGEFREEEIPELREIIRSIQKLHGQIQENARRYLVDNRDIWSSDEATQRDGRVVLALKSDYRGKVPGIVHGSSNSGQTIYIEPQELLEKNNALNEARSRYHQEVHKILRKCSAWLREDSPLIGSIDRRFTRFNSLQARARYASAISAMAASISRGGIILNAARHPALGKNAVPINIEMQGETRILVLSGPNTGGKTVSMKTLGLLSLMHQSGMEIPAGEGSALPIFSDLLVDIGDEQSIDAGLSTFSAHLKNLSAVLEGAKNNALVLLDELGSGTNPAEGSALSMAVMEHLSKRQVYAMVTTHHDILKAYAFSSPRMENASVEFDADSLKPTYNIIGGIPGESHALDIADRVGMNPAIVSRAREHMSEDGISMQELIEDLRRRQSHMRSLELELQKRQSVLAKKAEEIEEQTQQIALRELALKEEKLLENDRFLAESRKKAEKIIYQLTQERRRLRRLSRRAGSEAASPSSGGEDSDDREINRSVREALDSLSRDQAHELDTVRNEQEKTYSQTRSSSNIPFTPGDRVRYKGGSKPAEILEAGKKRNSWTILAGSMKMTVSEKDLELVQSAGRREHGDSREKVHIEYNSPGTSSGGTPGIRTGLTLDVRGMRLEAALDEVRKFMDGASVDGLAFFSVIHGKGTGVLQQGIHRFLEDQSAVRQISFAPPEDGGYGKTYVYLD